jgi:hypothetical protein
MAVKYMYSCTRGGLGGSRLVFVENNRLPPIMRMLATLLVCALNVGIVDAQSKVGLSRIIQ